MKKYFGKAKPEQKQVRGEMSAAEKQRRFDESLIGWKESNEEFDKWHKQFDEEMKAYGW